MTTGNENPEPECWCRIYKALDGASPDELRVVAIIAERIAKGRRDYGPLDVASDSRSWRRERAEEYADALVYGAIEEVARCL